MRAAVLHEHGAAPVVEERDDPERGPGQALVAVAAAPITPLDVLCASGTSYFGPPELSYVPGVQGVGVVEEAGGIEPGTRVWFPTTAGMAPGDGAMAERVAVDETTLVPLGAEVDDAHLAALGLSAVAAWTALLGRGALVPGERVLVLGSSGVVGRVAVRAAVLHGAGAVFAAAREPLAEQEAYQLGANGFVALRDDDDPDGLAERVREVCGEVDVVLDPLCGVPATAAARCLAPRGRLVNLGSSAGAEASFSSAHLRSGSRSVLGYTNNDLSHADRVAAMTAIVGHAAAGRLAVPHEVVDLADATAGWERHVRREAAGRVVLRLA